MMTNDASFVGSIPQHYDAGLGPIIFAGHAADMARRVAALQPARVLETAAGTGIVTRQLRNALPTAHIIATDLNPPMLDIARGKFAPGEQIEFRQADAMALPFGDGAFDAVVCQFGVMFYPDKDKSYREVLRVLAPGGHYLFSVWDAHRYNAFGRITHKIVGDFFPLDPPQFQSVPFSYAFEPIKHSLIEAGFADITVSVARLERSIPDAAAFAQGLVYGSPIIDQVRARGGVDPEDIKQALVAAFHAEFGADPGRMTLQAMMVSAKKPG